MQDRLELEHVFNLMKGCNEYLEIGTAEGNGLYVLSHALKEEAMSHIYIVDFGEKHTEAPRREVIEKLNNSPRMRIHEYTGNSHDANIIRDMQEVDGHLNTFDAVFIDAGHTYEDVIADAIAYGHLATKYIFFHDIQLPEVRKAFDWYCAQNTQFKRSEFINSTNYGYGILEV